MADTITKIKVIENGVETVKDIGVSTPIKIELDKKQDKLTSGEGITIDENNVISASGGGITQVQAFSGTNTEITLDNRLEDLKQYTFMVLMQGKFYSSTFVYKSGFKNITYLQLPDKTITITINTGSPQTITLSEAITGSFGCTLYKH